MKMEGNNRPPLSERLPFRKPDRDVWPNIESKLNHPTTPLSRKLPVHQPDVELWGKISGNLPVAPNKKHVLAKFAIALLLLLFVFFAWMYFPKNQADNFSDNVEKTGVAAHPEISGSTSQNSGVFTDEEISAIDNTAIQPLTNESNIAPTNTTPSIFTTEKNDFDQKSADKNHLKMPIEAQSAIGQNPSPANPGFETSMISSRIIIPNNYLNLYPQRIDQLATSSYEVYTSTKKVCWEIGGYMQASGIQNVSTINNKWYYKPELGISVGVRSKRFLFETGMSVSRFSFEDRIEFEYFEAMFLGTLITADKWVIEEYIDEDGMPQTRQKLIVELIDIYDTTFVEQVQDDRVMLSVATVPLTFGYRLRDNGKVFYDLKTGIDLMIIDGDVFPGNWQTPALAERLEFHHSFVGKYSLKWKYHIAMVIGYWTNGRLSVYAAPSVWWYPAKIQQKESGSFKNPVEAGLRIGIKWEL
jgi:hypothetical protein